MIAQITPLSDPPSRADPENFVERSDQFMSELPVFAIEANELALEVNAKSQATAGSVNAAALSAATATTQADLAMGYRNTAGSHATTATTQAGDAAASAVQASKLNLGSKSAPPATDNQGAALLAGATYYDTTLEKWRVRAGAAWGDGISAVAGVSSINGLTGDAVITAESIGAASIGKSYFLGSM